MAMSTDISLLVVGGGPAGITAAVQASEFGGRVTLLEAGHRALTLGWLSCRPARRKL
jgi:thioredoxin reductase